MNSGYEAVVLLYNASIIVLLFVFSRFGFAILCVPPLELDLESADSEVVDATIYLHVALQIVKMSAGLCCSSTAGCCTRKDYRYVFTCT